MFIYLTFVNTYMFICLFCIQNNLFFCRSANGAAHHVISIGALTPETFTGRTVTATNNALRSALTIVAPLITVEKYSGNKP